MLCLRWFDKQSVCVLSTKHTAFQLKVEDNYLGQPVIKPVVIQENNLKVGSVDYSDHFLAHYQTQKVPSTLKHGKHGSSQFLHTEQKIWGHVNNLHLLQRVHSKLSDFNISGDSSTFEEINASNS